MAEIFIAWNQNYNKFIDFLSYQLKSRKSYDVTVHVFAPKYIAEKNSPRNLPWVLKHECLTDTNDSPEAHLIAYLLRNYTAEKPDSARESTERQHIVLLQTRPGQHEELFMLLTEMPAFQSKNVASIYEIDKAFTNEIEDTDEIKTRRKNDFRSLNHNREENNSRKGTYPGFYATSEKGKEANGFDKETYPDLYTENNNRREVNDFRKGPYPDFYAANGVGREANNFRKKASPDMYTANNNRRDMNVFRKDSDEREIYNERYNPNRNEPGTSSVNEFLADYERHKLCADCMKGIKRGDEYDAPSTRRTWPNTRSGRNEHEESWRVCGLCLQKFHCFRQSGRQISIRGQNSFDSVFDNFKSNFASKSDEITIADHFYPNGKPPENMVIQKQGYAPWGNNKNLKCSCTGKHICTKCFLKKISGQPENIAEKNSEDVKTFPSKVGKNNRPDSSPAALHGIDSGKKGERMTEIRDGKNVERFAVVDDGKMAKSAKPNAGETKGIETGKILVEEGKTGVSDGEEETVQITSASKTTSSAAGFPENNSIAFPDEFAKYDLQTNIEQKDQRTDSKKEQEVSSDVGEYSENENDEFQNQLEQLLARLGTTTAEGGYLGDERSQLNDKEDFGIDGERKTSKVNGRKSHEPDKEFNLPKGERDEKLYNQMNLSLYIDENNKTGTPSRINSYASDYDQIISANHLHIEGDYPDDNGLNTSQKEDHSFDYGIFDNIDKGTEDKSNGKMKARRNKHRLKGGSIPAENGSYICKYCPGKKFSSVHVWKIHMKNMHKKCNCPCGEYFETREDYLAHFYKLFPLACFVERKCPERFRSLYFQAVHHREKHFSDRPFYCVQCFEEDVDPNNRRRTCFKDIKSLRIHAESLGHDPSEMYLISSQFETDNNTLPWSMKCTGIDFC